MGCFGLIEKGGGDSAVEEILPSVFIVCVDKLTRCL